MLRGCTTLFPQPRQLSDPCFGSALSMLCRWLRWFFVSCPFQIRFTVWFSRLEIDFCSGWFFFCSFCFGFVRVMVGVVRVRVVVDQTVTLLLVGGSVVVVYHRFLFYVSVCCRLVVVVVAVLRRRQLFGMCLF